MRRKTFRRLTATLLAVLMVVTVMAVGFPLTASAEQTAVTYAVYSWDDETKTLSHTDMTVPDYTEVTEAYLKANDYTLEGGTSAEDSKVFVVKESMTLLERLKIKKQTFVDLVIPEGVTLTPRQGISCSYGKKGGFASLRIFGAGKIDAGNKKACASIGGDSGEVNGPLEFHGPEVVANGYTGGAGIGGGKMTIWLRNNNDINYRGNEAIGSGANDSKSGSVYISHDNNGAESYMRVRYQDNDNWVAVNANKRTSKLHSRNNVLVEPCDHTDGNGVSGLTYTINDNGTHNEKCKYCGYENTEAHTGDMCACGYEKPRFTVMLISVEGFARATVAEGNSFTLPHSAGDIVAGNANPTDYHQVTGWTLEDDTTGPIYQPGSDVTVTSDMTFHLVTEPVLAIETTETQYGNGGEISYNTATTVRDETFGGGPCVMDGTVTVNGTKFIGNYCKQNGGAMYLNDGGTLDLTDVTVTGNRADGQAGGVRKGGDSGNTLNISGKIIIKDNSANLGNDLFLCSDKNVTIAGKLTEGTSIGVALESGNRVFTNSFNLSAETRFKQLHGASWIARWII